MPGVLMMEGQKNQVTSAGDPGLMPRALYPGPYARCHAWYEDLVLGQKYQMAAKLKLRGDGFYYAFGPWPDWVIENGAAVAAKWARVRGNFVQPHQIAAKRRNYRLLADRNDLATQAVLLEA